MVPSARPTSLSLPGLCSLPWGCCAPAPVCGHWRTPSPQPSASPPLPPLSALPPSAVSTRKPRVCLSTLMRTAAPRGETPAQNQAPRPGRATGRAAAGQGTGDTATDHADLSQERGADPQVLGDHIEAEEVPVYASPCHRQAVHILVFLGSLPEEVSEVSFLGGQR